MINPFLLATLILSLQATPLHIDAIHVETVNRGYATLIHLDVSGCKPLTMYDVLGKRNTYPNDWIEEATFVTTTNQTMAGVDIIYPSSYKVTSAMYRIKQR